MSEKTKGKTAKPIIVQVGNVQVKIYRRRRIIRGAAYTAYSVADYSSGKRQFITLADEKAARSRANEIAARLANREGDVLTLTSSDRASYLRALELIRPTGASLEMVAAEYAHAHAKLEGRQIAEAVNYFVKQHPATLPDKTVAEVVAEMLAAKKAERLSRRHIEDLNARLEKFSADFKCQIAGANGTTIKDWIQNLDIANRTRNNFRLAIQTLCSFAKKEGYLPRDWNELEKVPVWKTTAAEVEIFRPEEITKLLSIALPNFVPFLAIGAFAGLRSAEIERLDWSRVDLSGGYITVGADIAKTNSRRLVPITPNLNAWLKPHAKKSGPVVEIANTANAITRMIEATKPDEASAPTVKWKHNGLRHSFCSYRLAEVKNTAQVALEAGNSPQMIFRHYRELVSEERAKEWFAIQPGK